MSPPDVREEIAAYWNARAPLFDGAASHVRHAAQWRSVLAAAFEADRPLDVVDLGCGTGACALIAASLGHRVRAVDGSASMLEIAEAAARRAGLRVEFVRAFLDEVALPDARADVVTIRNVLWTLARPESALALARHLLRPGGRVVVADGLWSVSPQDRSTYSATLAARLPLHRGVTESDARRLLEAAGFASARSWQHLFGVPPYPGGTPHFVLSALKPAS